MEDIFGVPADKIPDNAEPSMIETWDSLKHMMLLLALEEEFDIRFSDEEMVEMLSLPIIIDVISAKCAEKQ